MHYFEGARLVVLEAVTPVNDLQRPLHTGYGPYPVNGYNPNVAHDNALFLFPFVRFKSSITIFTKVSRSKALKPESEEKGRDLKNIVLLLIIWDLGKNPYGFCEICRDQNRRADQNPNAIVKPKSNFQRNLKELARDHLQSCISISPMSSDLVSNENSNQHGNGFSCWGCNNAKNKDHNEKSVLPMSKRRSQVLDRWAAQQARRTITEIERKGQDPMPVLDRWAAQQARERITAIERKSHKPMLVLDRSAS
ncbi:hypothetical protein AKJ16_DCAP04663 [Drosera capensis]